MSIEDEYEERVSEMTRTMILDGLDPGLAAVILADLAKEVMAPFEMRTKDEDLLDPQKPKRNV